MGDGERKKGEDFYAVLGVKKECSVVDLRIAYRKLAMKWHPDRCSALGNMMQVEEAKKKFQAIQEAYSVLSDDNKRLLYDIGLYSNDDDDENGMADFMSEMADMVSQNKCTSSNGNETLADLKDLFVEMFQSDLDSYGSSSMASHSPFRETSNPPHKRNSTQMNHGNTPAFDVPHFEGFRVGMSGVERRSGVNSRRSRK